jgi:hypothetical protein
MKPRRGERPRVGRVDPLAMVIADIGGWPEQMPEPVEKRRPRTVTAKGRRRREMPIAA